MEEERQNVGVPASLQNAVDASFVLTASKHACCVVRDYQSCKKSPELYDKDRCALRRSVAVIDAGGIIVRCAAELRNYGTRLNSQFSCDPTEVATAFSGRYYINRPALTLWPSFVPPSRGVLIVFPSFLRHDCSSAASCCFLSFFNGSQWSLCARNLRWWRDRHGSGSPPPQYYRTPQRAAGYQRPFKSQLW